jgi:large repetitive protein
VFRAVVVTAILVLLTGCARPQGTVAIPTLLPSPTPVHHDPLIISNPVFHSGEVGVTYTPVTLSATGGVAPYTWTVPVGSLPGGLTLSSDGVVSGTPTANGYFAFSVQVLDAGSNDTAGVSANIPIVPGLSASLVSSCATECTVELGCVTVCGTFGQVNGGAAPLTYKLTSGPLPAGTTLNGLRLNGTFTGLPGRLQFTVQVTDGFGATATISPRYNLLPHISLAGGTCASTGGTCSVQLPYSGGTPGKVPSLKVGQFVPSCTPAFGCGPPPSQFSATVSGGDVNITAAQFTPPSQGTYTLTLTDQNLCAAGTYCTSQPATLVVNVYVS